MSSSLKVEMNMCVCVQRKCFAEHYGDGVRDSSVSMVSFLKIRNGLGARKGENRIMDPNTLAACVCCALVKWWRYAAGP